MPPHLVDVAVAELAAVQHGLFSRAQARAAGASDTLVARRVRAGRWIVAAPGVYSLPGFAPAFRRSLWLALLTTGGHAVVGFWSAAALHQLKGFPPARFDVLVPHATSRWNGVARVHQTRTMPEPVTIDGLPVTPVARTLVDLGKIVGPRRLGDALDDAIAARKVTLSAVQREFLALACQGRPGITTMRVVLADRAEDGYVPPHSTLERALDEFLGSIPGIMVTAQVHVEGCAPDPHRVDRMIDGWLIVEGDGRRWHTRVRDFQRDRERDRRALLLGHPTVRYTWDDLTAHRHESRRELVAILRSRGNWSQ